MSIDEALTRRRAEMPLKTASVLERRTLEHDYSRLHQFLEPGQSVLDVGCGSGAITAGIAAKVQGARVVGLDASMGLLERARGAHSAITSLEFVQGDVYALPFEAEFEVVCCARVLQWLGQPRTALEQMLEALQPGGRLFVLDYVHPDTRLEPEPPESMQLFRGQFDAWKAQAGMDVEIGNHLEAHFRALGLQDIQVTEQLERTIRGDHDFEARIGLWADVVAARGPQLVMEGWVSALGCETAEREFREWIQLEAQSQTLRLVSVEGTKPS